MSLLLVLLVYLTFLFSTCRPPSLLNPCCTSGLHPASQQVFPTRASDGDVWYHACRLQNTLCARAPQAKLFIRYTFNRSSPEEWRHAWSKSVTVVVTPTPHPHPRCRQVGWISPPAQCHRRVYTVYRAVPMHCECSCTLVAVTLLYVYESCSPHVSPYARGRGGAIVIAWRGSLLNSTKLVFKLIIALVIANYLALINSS